MRMSVWTIGIAIALVLILLVGIGLVASWSWGGGYGWGMVGPGMMGGWWGFPFMGPIFGLVFVALIIGGVIWFVQTLARSGPQSASGSRMAESPMEISKRRYASGEITKEQFEEIKRTLGSS